MPTRVVPPRHDKVPTPWHYPQTLPDDSIHIVPGVTYEALVKNVMQYRIDNDLPLGDPPQDVKNYTDNKRIHARTTKPIPKTKPPKIRSGLDKVRLWHKLAKNTPFKPVQPATATARSNVCLECPMNVPVASVTSCGPCITKLKRDATILTQNKPNPKGLAICRNLWQDNRVAAWIPEEQLERSKQLVNAETPDFCWVAKLK